MFHSGRGGSFSRGRGRAMFPLGRGRGAIFSPPSGVSAGMDARDKLIRPVTDARNVIRRHVVEKVGDLRRMLPRKRGIGTRPRDLRTGLNKFKDAKNGIHMISRPKLVYASDLSSKPAPTNRYSGPKNTNVTVSSGGKVTISRVRGRSIDRDTEESVQPTGIPAHMRRQPSPPAPREPSPPPSPSPDEMYQSGGAPYSAHSPQGYRMPSYSPPRRAHGYGTSKHMGGGDAAVKRKSTYNDWPEQRTASNVYDYRHRSRSPVHRDGRPRHESPSRTTRPAYRPRSRERFRRTPPQLTAAGMSSMSPDPYSRVAQPPPQEHWVRRRSPSPTDHRDRRSGQEYHRPHSSPPHRYEPRDRHSYEEAVKAPSHQSSLRMDRPDIIKLSTYGSRKRSPAAPLSRRGQSPDPKPLVRSENQMTVQQQKPAARTFYTIRVTSLSHEVSEEDVVELFSDIGELVSARLITKGHAEVSFVNKKDARTAIEKYDRRELDGIPMNLKLVERPSTARFIKS